MGVAVVGHPSFELPNSEGCVFYQLKVKRAAVQLSGGAYMQIVGDLWNRETAPQSLVCAENTQLRPTTATVAGKLHFFRPRFFHLYFCFCVLSSVKNIATGNISQDIISSHSFQLLWISHKTNFIT